MCIKGEHYDIPENYTAGRRQLLAFYRPGGNRDAPVDTCKMAKGTPVANGYNQRILTEHGFSDNILYTKKAMIKKQTLNEILTALQPSKDQYKWKNPTVVRIVTGQYRVSGSGGKWYEVTCGRQHNGLLFVACTCKAGQFGGSCYHALAAIKTHIKQRLLEKIQWHTTDQQQTANR